MLEIREAILPAYSALVRQALRREIDLLIREIEAQPTYELSHPQLTDRARERLNLVVRIMQAVEAIDARKRQATAYFTALTDRLAVADTEAVRQTLMLRFLEYLDPNPRRLRKDRRAFRRYMGYDVVEERYRRRIVREDTLLRLAVTAIGHLTSWTFDELAFEVPDFDWLALMAEMKIEPFLNRRIHETRRWQNKVAAFQALEQIVRALPVEDKLQILGLETVQSISRYCLDPQENIWIQIGALRLLAELSPEEAVSVFRRRLFNREGPSENLFVRKAILEIIAQHFQRDDVFQMLRQFVEDHDESDSVRMQLVRTIAQFQTEEARDLLRGFLQGDVFEFTPQVRAQAVLEWSRLAMEATTGEDPALLEQAKEYLAWAIREANDPMVQRIAAEEAAQVCGFRATYAGDYELDAFDRAMLEALEAVAATAEDVRVRRWAEEAWNLILLYNTPEYRQLELQLVPRLEAVRPGHSLRVPRAELPPDEMLLGRILAELARQDFGLYVEVYSDYVRIFRGDRFRMKPWRILHEVRNLSPEKRQGYRHTIGRHFTGTIRAHPGLLGEVTKTKVPGERYYIRFEGSWRRHIPLLDDYLSACRSRYADTPIRIFSSYGVTTIYPPPTFLQRWKAYWQITWNYAEIAELRNSNPANRVLRDVRQYLRRLAALGFRTVFTPYAYEYQGQRYTLRDETLTGIFEIPEREGAPLEASDVE